MRKLVVLIVFLFPLFMQGQEVEQKTDVEQGIFKINFIPLSASYELKVAERQTALIQGGFSFGTYNSHFYLSPTVTGQYRYYYNFDARNMKGKRTAKNSVNFVGAVMDFSFWSAWQSNDAENTQRYFLVGPVWGIQRNYPKHFSLGITLGPAIAVGNKGVWADAYIELTLGFWLGKK
jgi:hypothetical protein